MTQVRQESDLTGLSHGQCLSPDGESLSNSVGGSGPLLPMYLEMVSDEDKVIAKRWADDASEILLFTGLFSAVVAALLVESMKQLKAQSTDVSAFYLQNIYGVLANQSNAPTGVPVIADFPQPSFAVWVNALWFLSLANSLSCALLATMVQLWARQYTEAGQSKDTLHERALMHAFFAEGAKQSRLPLLVDFIPFLLHVSFFTFFAGLFLFLLDLHPTIVRAVYSLIGFYAILYLYATLHPIFRRNNPLHSPLSPLVWSLYTGILFVVLKILRHFTTPRYFSLASWKRIRRWEECYRGWFQDGIEKAGEDSARTLSSDIFGHALVRTLKSLNEDSKQEKFFEGIPDFCNSAVLASPKDAFKTLHGKEISEALIGFLHHTLISDMGLTFEDKERRVEICRRAMDAASLPITRPIMDRVLYKDWNGLLNTVEFGLFLSRVHHNHPKAEYRSKCMVAVTIATVRERDNRWFELTTSQLGLSRLVLEYYLEHDNNVLLANCIHICRRMIEAYSQHHWDIDADRRSKCLEIVSSLDCRNILPELQREFCCLWNDLGRMTRDLREPRIRSVAMRILRHIRKVYGGLHEGTNTPSPSGDYPNIRFFPSPCNDPDHVGIQVGPGGETPHNCSPASPTATRRTTTAEHYSSPHAPKPAHGSFGALQHTIPGAASFHSSPVGSSESPARSSWRERHIFQLPNHITNKPRMNSRSPVHPVSLHSSPISRQPLEGHRHPGQPVNSDPHSASLAPLTVPLALLAPSSGSTIAPSPSASFPFKLDQTDSGLKFLPSTPPTAIPQASPVSNPNVTPNVLLPGVHDDSQGPDFPIPVEAPYDPHQSAQPVPDTTTDHSCSPPDAVPSSHDVTSSQ